MRKSASCGREEFLFTFKSLTDLRKGKARYGRLGSSHRSPKTFVSHEKEMKLLGKQEACGEWAEVSL